MIALRAINKSLQDDIDAVDGGYVVLPTESNRFNIKLMVPDSCPTKCIIPDTRYLIPNTQ